MKFGSKVPRLVGAYSFLVGLFIIITNVSRRFKGPRYILENYVAVYLNSTAFATAIFSGLLLLGLARGLSRRKRRAWQIAIVMLILSLLTEVFRFHAHPVQNALTIIFLALLIIFRREFYAKSDPSTRFRPIFAFAFGFTFFLLAGILLYYFRHSQNVVGAPTLIDVVETVLLGFLWIEGPVRLASDLMQDTIRVTLGVFGIFVILIPVWAYLRRVSSVPKSTEEEKAKIADLATRFGSEDSLAFFATREDKSVIWSKNQGAGIAYRVQNGVMLASGDPFGEYSLWPEAIEAFLAKAREYAWTPAVIGASERGGKVWVDIAGLSAIEIGDEAIIDVNDYTLEGRPMANVRQTINKARREGFSATVRRVSEIDMREREELRSLARSWRGSSQERGFSMSMDRFLGELDNGAILVVGWHSSTIVGFLYFIPWGRDSFSLDRMQRAPQSLPGLTELLIDAMVTFCKENKYRSISLNFAAFRSVIERSEKISAGPLLRLVRTLIRSASGWFQVESLYRFNAKFHPEWNARYLLYPGVADLGRVILAALRAEKFLKGFGKRSS